MLKMGHIRNEAAKMMEENAIGLLEGCLPFIHTVTIDKGKEFVNHRVRVEELKIDFFFAKPYHRWERVANENLNGLDKQ